MRFSIAALLFLISATVAAQKAAAPAPNSEASKSAMVAEWRTGPTLDGRSVRGTVVVTNQSDDAFDQTVIVEAVNEIGKAFALGYQHFTLAPHSVSLQIRFDATLPPGKYVVHADAVAEVASRNAIHRQHLEVPKPFVVSEL